MLLGPLESLLPRTWKLITNCYFHMQVQVQWRPLSDMYLNYFLEVNSMFLLIIVYAFTNN